MVIPVFNRREITLAGLRSLLACDTTGLDLVVIVVDDASPDGTAEAISVQLPEVEVHHGTGALHYAGGTELGLRAALRHDPELIITANDDAEFAPDVLQKMVAAVDRHPGDLVGALLVRGDDPDTAFQVGLHFDVAYGGWHVPQRWAVSDLPTGDFEVETLVGNLLLVPAEAVRSHGPMDGRRFAHGLGDVQWVRTMQRSGRRCWIATDARVRCRPNDVAAPQRERPRLDLVRTLLWERDHPLNLGHHWVALWHSAPTRQRAVAAFGCHVAHLVSRAAGIGTWPGGPDPELPR